MVGSLVDADRLGQRQLLGVSAEVWLAIALLIPIAHQVFVWFAWRSELCWAAMTSWQGTRAFPLYQVGFFVLFLGRPTTLILLAVADHDSFVLPVSTRILVCLFLSLPAGYTVYSVVRYFGLSRATGADHFDESTRQLPLVTQGIFRYSRNPMYTFGFFTFWIIAIAAASWSALVVAAFSHAYIWVHYLGTERPDMRLIYG